MQFHIEYDIAAIVMILVCYIYTFVSFDGTKISTKQYKHMMGVICIAALLDILASYTISIVRDIPIEVNYWVNSIYYFVAASSMYFLPRYIRFMLPNPIKMRFVDQLDRLILIIYSVICFTCPFSHLLFYFDENNSFCHGKLYLLVFIVPVYFIILAGSRGIFFRRALTTKQFWAIIAFTLLGVFVILLQLIFFPTYNLTYFGSAIGLFIILYSLETPDYAKLTKAMEELENAKEDAMFANQAKSSFLASMSHEIRTPINGILGMNEIAINENTDPQIEEYLYNIQSAGQNLLGIINDILDFSKIESGKLEIHPEEYMLSDVLYSINNLLLPKASEKGLELLITNNSNIPNKLYGDDTRVRQVIINILNNAIKYTEKGSVKLNLDYKQDAPNQIELIIKITDTGIGIAKEDLPKLFQNFQRVDEKRNRAIEGTGLGLTITKQLTELMNGTIDVESEYGVGSTFSVVIPQRVVSESPIGVFGEEESPHTKPKTNSLLLNKFKAPDASILVVDDNELNRKVIVGLLKNTQMQIELADSGRVCLDKCYEKTYDLILLDHMMPGMDGIETLMHIKSDIDSKNLKTPVVVLTANAIAGAKEEYLKHGFNDFLAKPIDTNLLYEILIKYLPNDKYSINEKNKELTPEEDECFNVIIDKLKPLLDTVAGIKYCANQKNLYVDLVNHFAKETLEKELIDSFFKLDWKTYGTIAHGIKSASKTIGAKDFSNFAKRMEDACKEERVEIILTNHDSFIEEYKQLQEDIKKLLE